MDNVVPLPDMFRGIYRLTEFSEEECGRKYADHVELVCQNILKRGKKVAGFIAESISSNGG